jgi:hypothetical protein
MEPPDAEQPTPPNPTPTRICERGFLQLDFSTRMSIRDSMRPFAFKLEEVLEWDSDPTLIYGIRLFSSMPQGKAFTFVTSMGTIYQCRAYVDGIIVVDECASPCQVAVILWDAGWRETESGYVWEGK